MPVVARRALFPKNLIVAYIENSVKLLCVCTNLNVFLMQKSVVMTKNCNLPN